MPSRLKSYQETHNLHFITFTCYHWHAYLSGPSTRDLFEEMLEQTRRLYRFFVTGYVVMPEHVHLLVSEPERRILSVALQALAITRRARSASSKLNRSGQRGAENAQELIRR